MFQRKLVIQMIMYQGGGRMGFFHPKYPKEQSLGKPCSGYFRNYRPVNMASAPESA